MKVTRSDKIRQLLREGDWNSHALAMEVDCDPSYTYQLLQKEIASGNVAFVDYCVDGKARYKRYTWVGDDDLITMAKRAADYLEEHAKDQLGQSIAKHLLRMTT